VTVWLEGVGLLAPGIPNWETGIDVLQGRRPYAAVPSVLPAASLLPPAESRRASRLVKLCLALGLEACAGAGRAAGELASVFCSSNPDGHTIHAILECLASSERLISPTRFHNSVHNAAAGYWSIAVRSPQPCQVLCAYDATFAAAILEAATYACVDHVPVLMLACDSEYPEPFRACRAIPDAGGIALVLSPAPTPQARARLQLQLRRGPAAQAPAYGRPGAAAGPAGQIENTQMSLENIASFIPALAGLSLLEALANRLSTTIDLPYSSGQSVVVQVQAC
jgi:hypothetical protein